MKAALLALGAACGATPAPVIHSDAPVVASRPLGPHATNDGLRGFEDGQPVTLAALQDWAPGTDVVAHQPGYFVFTPKGVRLTSEQMDDLVPDGAVAVIDYRSPYYPNMSVMRPNVTNEYGIAAGMTLAQAMEHAPALKCDTRDEPVCEVPGSRLRFITAKMSATLPPSPATLIIKWWVWNGSGRARGEYKQPIDKWMFTAGGIGPIDGFARARVDDIEKRIAAFAPGVTVVEAVPTEPEISQDVAIEIVKGGEVLVELLGYRKSGGLSQMRTRSKAFPTRMGVRVGDTLATVKKKIDQVPCTVPPDGDRPYPMCWAEGVRYRFTPDDLVVEQIDTEVY